MLPTALLIGAFAASAAERSSDRAAAAAAFEAGDYLSAEQLYLRTREAASKSGDDRAWIADTVALARVYLSNGEPAKAQKLSEEFNLRFSVLDSGGLRGEILAAEGHVREAKEFFRELAGNPLADARSRGEAELALAYLQLNSGDEKELAEALKTLEKLEQDAHFATEARLRRIYALIRCGRPQEALELAGKSKFDAAPSQRRLEILKLLAMLKTGAADDFDAEWRKVRGDILPHPDRQAFETLDLAAENAVKNSHPERAELYWNDAYGFADRNEVRRDVLRKLFNCCASVDAHKAAAVAKRCIELFPDSGADGESLAERAQILLGAGRLLGAAGDHKEALTFFRMVADDSKMPPDIQRAAAEEIVAAAEKDNDDQTAERYFDLLVSTAKEPKQQQSSQMSYAEYLIRRGDVARGDFARAEKMLRGIVGVTDPELKNRAGRLLLQSLAAQDKFEDALTEAETLRHSADAEHADLGEFYAALMTDKLDRRALARERYLGYAKRYPKGKFIRQARFAAAKLAEESGDYAAAAQEFFAYGDAYSDDPNAGSALFWALRAACLAEDREVAVKAFEAIRRTAGVGPEYYAAALQLTDFLRRGKNVAETSAGALKILDQVDRSKCSRYEAAMLDLMRVRLLIACRRRDEAVAAAEKLLNDYPEESAAADAAFLAGDLYLEGNDPGKALPLLLRAGQRRPTGGFGDAVAVRTADCRVELYKANNSTQELQQAAAEFERLAGSETTMPQIRLVCKYKLGWCREQLHDPRGAVSAYHQALLYAVELKRLQRTFDSKWCSRSAYAALNILLDERWKNQWPWSDADQCGAAIIDTMKQLELLGGDAEFEALANEFKKRYLGR